jgi:cyclophilin family peptidyl-prolyl cis-trans isomerase
MMLGACGGGGGPSTESADKDPNNPGVNPTLSVEITSEPSPPMYFAPNTFVVTGDGVYDLSVSAQGACASVTEIASTSGGQRRFTCRPDRIGVDAIAITARNPQTQTQKAQAFTIPKPQVTLATSLGPLVVTLEPERAPLSTNNFLEVVATGFYDGTSIHEAAEGNRVLGGLYKLVGNTWSRQPFAALPPVKFESPLTTGLSNTAGTLAVYREGAALLDSGTTGFLINLGNHGTDANGNIAVNNNRDGKSTRDISAYAVFGSVNAEGYDRVNTAARTSQPGQLAGPESPTYMIPAIPISISTARQTR